MNIERWAQSVCERELGQTVVVHDDQSEPGMYDLRVGAVDAPFIAIECVSAVDSEFLKLWKVGPAQGPIQLALAGDWIALVFVGMHCVRCSGQGTVYLNVDSAGGIVDEYGNPLGRSAVAQIQCEV